MLIPFWFQVNQGLGYGVTAASQEEAEELLRAAGLPMNGQVVTGVIRGVRHSDLDQKHVVPNAGPIIVRGVWYPRYNLSSGA
jgi:hypothetical protein